MLQMSALGSSERKPLALQSLRLRDANGMAACTSRKRQANRRKIDSRGYPYEKS